MRLLLFTIFILIQFINYGQQLSFRNFNVENGLGQSQVYCLYENKDGSIWMGTQGAGISIYNGYNFDAITLKDGLPSNFINDFEQDQSGKIWIATNKGLCYFENGKINLFSILDKTLSITDLHYFNHRLYFATDQGVFCFDQTSSEISIISHLKANTVYVTSHDHILIGTNNGLIGQINGKTIRFGRTNDFMRNAITTIKQDKNGLYWIGTYGDGAYCYNGANFYRVDHNKELYTKTIFDFYIDEKNVVWMSSLSSGIILYDPAKKQFSTISEKEGLSNNHVRCVLKDRCGSLWMGTSGGGASQYLGNEFTFYNEESGFNGHYIYAVIKAKDGTIYAANSQNGFSSMNNDTVINYDASNGFKNVKVKSIYEDKAGKIWLGTNGSGIWYFDQGSFNELAETNGAYVKQICIDSRNNIWVATLGSGIIKINSNTLSVRKFNTSTALLSNRITSITAGKNGTIWYGTENNGVAKIDSDGRQTIHLDKASILSSNSVRSIVLDAAGNLIIGTSNAGVNFIEKSSSYTTIQQISSSEGLISDNIYLITLDRDENWIIGSERGLDYVYFNSDHSVEKVKHYGKMEGFSGVETCQNAVWNDKRKSIWIGTINGLCKFDPNQFKTNQTAPQLSFRDVKLNYISLHQHPTINLALDTYSNENIDFESGENNLIFEFIGVNLKNPLKVKYRWKLDGYEDNWAPISTDKSIQYSNIPAGNYIFKVQASNEDGIWTTNDLTFSFTIDKPFWQKTYFIVIFAALILVVIFVALKVYTYRIRKKSIRLENELKVKNELLELEQKALRLQMNPHFIFNAMNSIQSLIGTGQDTDARYYLAKFSRLMRQILDNSRKSEINLDEEIQLLENYLLIESFCGGQRFDYNIYTSTDLELDFITIPPMLIQPFIENSIKHGMREKTATKKGQIDVRFETFGEHLKCTVTDNGIGREKARQVIEASTENYHKSAGLDVTKERLKNFDKNNTSIEIIDLYEGKVATGTQIIIIIPL